MMMSTEEILYSYHNAACRTKQIGILADLNACSRDEITRILEENGEDIPKRKYTKRKKPVQQDEAVQQVEQKEEPAAEPEKAVEHIKAAGAVPDFIAQILLEKLDEIDGKLAEAEKAKKEYESQYYTITDYLGITRGAS